MSESLHFFHAVAFVENLSLKDWAAVFPSGKRSTHELRLSLDGSGEVFAYPFGAIVFRDVADELRNRELDRLREIHPMLSLPVVQEELAVREGDSPAAGIVDGTLVVDELTPDRSGVIAHTVAQSAALEYYERIVEEMFGRTAKLVDRLEIRGTVSWSTRPLLRFIGSAISTRNEVLAILHLLDKPDEAWEDPGIERIYDELRMEFDLVDRFAALETKLRSLQESLEMLLDVARERRLVLLEMTVVLLFVTEIVMSFLR